MKVEVCFYQHSTIKYIRFYNNEKLHNNNGPAEVLFGLSGNVMEINYYNNGLLHRNYGPAKTCFIQHLIFSESFYKNGTLHRINGPARILYTSYGLVNEYYINGDSKTLFDMCKYLSGELIINTNSIFALKFFRDYCYKNNIDLLDNIDGKLLILILGSDIK